MRRNRFILLAAAALLASCGSSEDPRDFSLRELTLPNGSQIRFQALRTPTDMARGAMFRDKLPSDRGLLYEYAKPGRYSMWMYQTQIPLDTVWMDANHRVVEIVDNMPPCPSKSAQQCPHYGGNQDAQFVLQLAAGEAKKNAVGVGSLINF